MPSITSPVRRVLGEKDANASLRLASPRNTTKASIEASIRRSPTSQTLPASERPQSISSSPRTARKRRISEVDSPASDQDRENITESQRTDIISDSASDDESIHESQKTAASVLYLAGSSLTSAGTVPEDQYMQDAQFDLPREEMSQRTRDKLHAVSLPQNDWQPQTLERRGSLRREDSQISLGMSAFLDLDGSDASQGSGEIVKKVEGPPLKTSPCSEPGERAQSATAGSTQLSEKERRGQMLLQQARDLRTRLQYAYFKVQTNQTTTPMSRLKVPESMRRVATPNGHPTNIARLSTTSGPSFSLLPPTQTQPQPSLVINLEERMSAMRARATAQSRPAVRSLESIPVPRIVPTAFSARFHDTTAGSPHTAREHSEESLHLGSSPPHRRTSKDNDGERGQSVSGPGLPDSMGTSEETPQRQHGNRSLSEGESDAEKADTITHVDSAAVVEHSNINDVKTSVPSPVKGAAADCLLQLLHGAEG